MSTVPYTFANASGNVPASQLDANFANVKASANSAGIVTNPAQLNITSVGTLVSLNVAGNVTAANFVGNFIGSISNAVFANTATTATTANRAATVTTAVQPNITGVGTLTLLNVTGNVDANGANFGSNVTVGNIFAGGYYWANGAIFSGGTGGTPSGSNTQVQFNDNGEFGGTTGLTFNKNTNALTVSGNVQGGNLRTTGIISAAGNVTSNQFIGSGAGLNSIPGANVTGTVANATYATSAGSATSATTAATVTTAAQPNITSVGTLTSVSVSGNVQGGNLRTTGQISATGNITGNYILGNGSQLTGIATSSSYAASQLTGNTLSSNVSNSSLTSVGTLTSLGVTGNITSSANISGNYILGNGSQLTGITANYNNSNVTTLLGSFGSNTISTTGNITGGNFIGNGASLSSITGANVTGTVSVAATATTAGTVTTAAQPNITSVGTLTSVSVTGNVQGGNLRTTGQISATGNITGGNFIGNGSQLTNLPSGPIFMAYNSSNQSLITGATVLIFGTTTVNTNSYYDTSTGLFTPLIAGYYQVNVSFTPELVSGTANAGFLTGLYKNGSIIAAGLTTVVTPTWGTIGSSSISTLVYLNGSTDYLGIASLNTITSGTWRTGISVANYFQAVRVSS